MTLTTVTTKNEFDNLFPSVVAYPFNSDETTVILVRHGENEANQLGVYDGRTLDMPLTEAGRLQVLQAAALLKTKGIAKIDSFLISPLQRTHETARVFMQVFNKAPIVADERMYERCMGHLEGKPLSDEIYLEYRKYERLILGNSSLSFEAKMEYQPFPEVESIGQVFQRSMSGLREFATANPNKTLLSVAHSGTMRALFWHFLATQKQSFVNYDNFKPDNCSIMVLKFHDNNFTLEATHRIKFKES